MPPSPSSLVSRLRGQGGRVQRRDHLWLDFVFEVVSNLTGSSMLEITVLSNIVPACVVLRKWSSRGQFTRNTLNSQLEMLQEKTQIFSMRCLFVFTNFFRRRCDLVLNSDGSI
ncbi:unnamed protein product [Urochloa humidicola]